MKVTSNRVVVPVLILVAVALLASTVMAAGKARIRFEGLTHDFGELRADEKVEFDWPYHNEGDGPLKILRTRSSCGCTMTLLDGEVIEAGNTGKLKIAFDPAGQHGSVTKTLSVVTNDPERQRVLLTVKAKVLPVDTPTVEGDHPPITGQSLLMGDCATCHAAPAEGKSGEELYTAICAMCHGVDGTGISAPSLRHPSYLESRSDQELNEGIAFGTTNPRMPGFGQLMGGPLTEDQIDTLVKLLRKWGPTTDGGSASSD